jgi:hypothetical protein
MAIQDQPPPKASDAPAIWPIVIREVEERLSRSLDGGPFATVAKLFLDDARERDRIGRERYGTPLQARNGRDALVDAYQEQLDAVVYLRQWCEETDAGEFSDARDMYLRAIEASMRTRDAIRRRDASAMAHRP